MLPDLEQNQLRNYSTRFVYVHESLWISLFFKSNYSGISLTGIPDNETPDLVIRYTDKFYPEFRGSRYPEYYTNSG